MNYIKITKTDIANGDGVRCVLWVSGCDVHCRGCHNHDSWDFDTGRPFTDETMDELIESINNPWIKGLTLSGGHPLACQNLTEIYNICKTVRERCPNKDIWLYTGYTLCSGNFASDSGDGLDIVPLMNQIIAMCDVVVDGDYREEIRDISLRFRGSKNQRIIDVQRSIIENKVCVMDG